MSSNSLFHRASAGPSSSAVYTQLPNDSTSLLDSSTQVDYSQDGIAGNKPDSNRIAIDTRDEDEIDEEEERRQDGVRQAEAITSSWTFRALVFTYVFIYILTFVNSLQQQVTGSLGPYVTSSFKQHSLFSTTQTLSSIVAGCSKLPIAKILDIWGRVEGFILMTVLCTLGLVLMAVCKDVETYAAAQVFYWVGYNGMGYVINIFLADTTSLRNRMIMFGLNSTPFIVTVFIGPYVAQLFHTYSTFRWAFGFFAIVVPVVSIPVAAIFLYSNYKARKMGLAPLRTVSGRTTLQVLYHYAREFDVIGLLLVVGGFSLLLLPLTLAASSVNQWHNLYIIAMLVIGVALLALFCVWEKYFAPVTFVPFQYLQDRTVFGACVLSATLFCSFYTWDVYFSSYLQVVHNQNIRNAGYIANIFTIGSSFWAPIAGLMIRYTGRFKWLGLAAVPVSAIFTAAMIYFRHPGTNISLIVLIQIFMAFSGGTLVMTEQLAAMSAVPHNEVAVVLALEGLFMSIGGSIGQSISGAIWTNILPDKLVEYLPDSEKANWKDIYGSLEVQLSYPVGSPARNAIIMAYGYVQRRMLLAGVCFMPLALGCVLLWKNIDVKGKQQTRGMVF
ncbi:siderophore iron transporter mirB [Aspergillus ruber CBS 135680]|uniref:Siderophore iron transporter mirB n=1 Tax=Aspergillus ruber (strain CBS 135680) TaxID=1388766 RepID=A0A017S0R1_ASPRC|nr:siderophore iron transporter mirB [Aspergillus ruber CBS 135680]EYE90522.1 siderophore iron transporter mirB [Aspergillus ruber CBS 135680]